MPEHRPVAPTLSNACAQLFAIQTYILTVVFAIDMVISALTIYTDETGMPVTEPKLVLLHYCKWVVVC